MNKKHCSCSVCQPNSGRDIDVIRAKNKPGNLNND